MLSTLILNSKSALFLMCGWLVGAFVFEAVMHPQRARVVTEAPEAYSSTVAEQPDAEEVEAVLMHIETITYEVVEDRIEVSDVQRLDIRDAEVQEAIQSAHELALELQDMSEALRKARKHNGLFVPQVSDGQRADSNLSKREGAGVCGVGSSR